MQWVHTDLMHYYEVLVGDLQYHGQDALTYSSDTDIPGGALVLVSLRQRPVLGVVTKEVSKPSFKVKPIGRYNPEYTQLPPQSLALLDWLRDYYPAPLGAIVRQFLPSVKTFPKDSPTAIEQKPAAIPALPPLTDEQENVLQHVADEGLSLLYGTTGSGKTRVYLELAQRAARDGKSALILTPEIGLTAQLVETFEAQFPGRVIVLHSQLTAATRRNIWYQILNSTEPLIVIGPRSALFAPLADIGLIVIDESHESAYKNESAPHYLSSRVAARVATLHKAKLVLGSATPLIEDYYFAIQKGRPILRMLKPATRVIEGRSQLKIVDLKNRDEFTKSTIISTTLQKAIAGALDRREQALVFLNRRGTAKVVLCSVCGWQVHCPRCDLPMTYHGDSHHMRCHVCGFQQPFPTSCPVCGNADVLLKSVGTKAVIDELHKLFPGATLKRFDTDSIGSERLEQNMSALKGGEFDIIVGTQIIAKGLDLPMLSVVGVINADTSLYLPDYTATERTFQLLSQVIGRVGRGHRPGKAIIQTYNPNNPALQASVENNWETFYTQELEERKTYVFPPFCYLLKLICTRSSSQSAEKAAAAFLETIRKAHPHLTVEGPSPAFHLKNQNKYRWQLIVKAKQRSELVQLIHELPSGWTYDIDPLNLL